MCIWFQTWILPPVHPQLHCTVRPQAVLSCEKAGKSYQSHWQEEGGHWLRRKRQIRKKMGLSCRKFHWKEFEDQLQNPVELIPCALWWEQLLPPALHLVGLQTCLFWLRTPSPFCQPPPSLNWQSQVWARVLSLEVLPLPLTTKNKPSQLSNVVCNRPSLWPHSYKQGI